jgi:DNA invertase Pin-like site-specific DNA recombinase
MRAIGYVRVSRIAGRFGEGFISPAEQRRAIEGLAARDGLEIVDWYEELDASGGDSTRPLWNKAIERIEHGEAKALAVWNISRFSRSLVDALKALERIESAGGALYSASGDVGDDSPTGRFTRNLFLSFAQMERERARDGFAVAQASAIDRGLATMSRIPVGYSRDPQTRKLVPDPVMAPVILRLFEMRVDAESWTNLARFLIESGGSSKTDRAACKWIIANPTYLGWSRSGENVNKKAHEPLVSQLLYDKANAVKGRKPHHDGSLSSQCLLSGIVVCEGCGHRMAVTRFNKGKAGYACRQVNCTARAAVNALDLDAEVVGRIMDYMNRITDARHYESGNEAEINADIEQAKSELEEAEYDRALFVKNRELRRMLTETEYNTELQSLTEAAIEARIAFEMTQARDSEPLKVARLREAWDSWTDESRREWLRTTIRDLLVRSAGRQRIPVSERMALRIEGVVANSRWLLPDGYYCGEPFGEARDASRIFGKGSTDSSAWALFTSGARQVVRIAQEEARELGHSVIGTEHILLGLFGEADGLAARVLESFEINLEKARAKVVQAVGKSEELVTGQIPFTPRLETVLEKSLSEAETMGHKYIGTEHILLGLLRESDDIAVLLLLDLGADADGVRQEVLRRLPG